MTRFFIVNKTVTTSGTQLALATTQTKVASVIIQALRTNTGYVTVADSTADYATNVGIILGIPAANATPASVVFTSTREANEIDLAKIYIDVSVNGEGVVAFCSEA